MKDTENKTEMDGKNMTIAENIANALGGVAKEQLEEIVNLLKEKGFQNIGVSFRNSAMDRERDKGTRNFLRLEIDAYLDLEYPETQEQ